MPSIDSIYKQLQNPNRTVANLTHEEDQEKFLCESSFFLFINTFWEIVEGAPLLPAYHLQVMAEHLEALYELEISKLLINLPPRLGKSVVCSVMYPAWVWSKEPHLSFLCCSYSGNLSVRDSVKCRRLIQSDKYQKYWGKGFKLTGDQNSKIRFDNDKGGSRFSTSIGGASTGFGAHCLIVDDALSAQGAYSQADRDSTNTYFTDVLQTRWAGDRSQFRRLVVSQRLHHQDVPGMLLSQANNSGYTALILPMEYEPHRKSRTIPLRMTKGEVWEDPRTTPGQLLWPQGLDEKALQELKDDLQNDSYVISAQLQQSPSPDGGGIIKPSWLKIWQERNMPECDYVLSSWDTALTTNVTSASSACTTWGIFKDEHNKDCVILLSLFSGRIEYPDLRHRAMRLYNNYYDVDEEEIKWKSQPDVVVIEGKANGQSLFQELRKAGVAAHIFNPTQHGDKVGRARRVTSLMENGRVYLPGDAKGNPTPSAQAFIKACTEFPASDSCDIIDSMSQALISLRVRGRLGHTDDYIKAPTYDFAKLGYEKKN